MVVFILELKEEYKETLLIAIFEEEVKGIAGVCCGIFFYFVLPFYSAPSFVSLAGAGALWWHIVTILYRVSDLRIDFISASRGSAA
jgi:hypothetical protein